MSTDDAEKRLCSGSYDACLVGPSILDADGAAFIKKIQKAAYSKDCAYIAIVNQGAHLENTPLQNSAHGIVFWPCTKKAFTDQAIKAILPANQNTGWSGIKLNEAGQIIVYSDGDWQVYETADTYSVADAPGCQHSLPEKVATGPGLTQEATENLRQRISTLKSERV